MSDKEIFMALLMEYADFLSADPLFAAARVLGNGKVIPIPVLAENIGDLESELQIALNQTGICTLVELADGDNMESEVTGPVINDLKIAVEIGEVGLVNRGTKSVPSRTGTLISAGAIATHVLAITHNRFRSAMLNGPLIGKKISRAKFGDVRVGYTVRFSTSLTLKHVPPQLDLALTTAGSMVSLASSTPHAQIFYTTNGAGPAPLVANFYTGPFAVAPGTQVKARAWLQGMLASNVINKTV